ncbi:hypothetical protein CERSUDRAFT_46110 [Gelatoporia subvermispora B]|uniref:RING-type domain-containing protein n=1 Tax=Ceriporiopsis subvermispora (strain B) TaxID=914234 RepID=M2PTC8_CERS8|nr:hypothetical protein CERSUDRAFT_46110 [Gelatoporia subvermispora B]
MSYTDTNSPALPSDASANLKRRASPSFEGMDDAVVRKRMKENSEQDNTPATRQGSSVDGDKLADELELELQCGCCSALVHRPVVVSPCQHFFCGSCCALWIRNGGTNCPACRSISTSVTPSRILETMVDVLVRTAPSKARSINERMQADDIYHPRMTLRIPSPRQASPEPNIPQNNSGYVRPCPHCLPGNAYGWQCAHPIPDPDQDPERGWHADDGTPPDHGYCGNCENILALRAPSTSKCDFCQVSFCGVGVPNRCVAAPLLSQHLHGMSDLGDLIQCSEVYDCFDNNAVEVDIMLDYLTAQRLTPRHIYREAKLTCRVQIVAHIQNQPRQFAPLIDSELFMDLYTVGGGVDPDPSAPRHKICRLCATEVLLFGLREWWVRERKKGFLDEAVLKRPDCPEGSACSRQKDHGQSDTTTLKRCSNSSLNPISTRERV